METLKKEHLKRQVAWDAAEGKWGGLLKAAGRESGWRTAREAAPWEAPS